MTPADAMIESCAWATWSGYGAEPNQVTLWAKSNVASVIRGNHDRACTGTDLLENFNPAARASAFFGLAARSHPRIGNTWNTFPGARSKSPPMKYRMAVSIWCTDRL